MWAMADQLVVSGGNFATTFVLMHLLPTASFGTYALINTVILVANGFHANMIICPLVVYGVQERDFPYRRYPTAALLFSSALFPVWLALIVATSVYLRQILPGFAAALAVLFWQFQETTRRTLFAVGQHRTALWGDIISYPMQAILIWVVMHFLHGQLGACFVVMAVTSFAAALLQAWQGRLQILSGASLLSIYNEFWTIAKWMILTSLAGFASAPLLPWLLNWARGREAVAAFQAILSIMNLTNPLVLSIPAIVIPAVAAGRYSVRQAFWRYTIQFELFMAPFLFFLFFFPRWALMHLCGNHPEYFEQTTALRIGVCACLLAVPLSVLQNLFAAIKQTRNNAIVQSIGVGCSLLIAPVLVYFAGIVGTIQAEVFARLLKTIGAGLLLQRIKLNSAPETSQQATPAEAQ